MIRNYLKQKLKQYVRRLWPYAVGLVVVSVFACLMFLFDKNPIELTGPMAAVAFFVMAALTFVVRGFIHAYASFYKDLKSEEAEQASFKEFLWAHILAYLIFVIFTALLIMSCVSIFAWEQIGKMFLALNNDWIYFIEFCIWLIISTATIYFNPLTWIVAYRYVKYKKLTLSIGIITLLTFEISIVMEILLLIHSSSTDMPSLWATMITMLVTYTLVDISMYLLTCRTLKSAFSNKKRE